LAQEYFSSYFFCRDKKSKQKKRFATKKLAPPTRLCRVRLRSTVFVAISCAFGAVYFCFFATEIAFNKIKFGQNLERRSFLRSELINLDARGIVAEPPKARNAPKVMERIARPERSEGLAQKTSLRSVLIKN
jgi:hypothetical protein